MRTLQENVRQSFKRWAAKATIRNGFFDVYFIRGNPHYELILKLHKCVIIGFSIEQRFETDTQSM